MKKTQIKIASVIISAATLPSLFWNVGNVFAQTASRTLEMTGRTISNPDREDEMTDQQVHDIQQQIGINVDRLRAEGKVALMPSADPVRFDWPVRKASGLRDFAIGLVSDYVDHNLAFPNQVIDWNCGTRTYDNNTGYNHRGTDIVSQPFPWQRMYQNEQYAVAAAPGLIVLKQDGMFDQNCSNPGPTGNWNAVYIMHPDGSVTWYGHLKNGSLTRKEIGQSVASGEYIGITGSSGSSTRPHLHFQVYNLENLLQDPYSGACNVMNTFSWWTAQEPYRNSQILALTTNSAAPEFPVCPMQEVTHEKIVFQPGDPLITTSFYRDQLTGQETQHSIIRPDGSTFADWVHVSPADYNGVRFWFRTWSLPPDAPTGKWMYRAVYNGQTYETSFYVGQPPSVSVGGRVTTFAGVAISGAIIEMNRVGSENRIASTNPFGYYRFDDLQVGETFNVTVSSKARTFHSRVLTVADELATFDHFSLE